MIEAVREVVGLKLERSARLGAPPPFEALLGTRPSTMHISPLAKACANSRRTIGMHFFDRR